MRISDWSSDVCSSDLPCPRTRRAMGSRPRSPRRPARGKPPPKRSAPPTPFRKVLPPARSSAVRPSMRSEEHTSELQSLMRISYAVFCLKKKNTEHHAQPEMTQISDETHIGQ